MASNSLATNFMKGHYNLWAVRAGCVIVLSTLAVLVLVGLTKQEALFVTWFPLVFILLVSRWWPVALDEGPHYVAISPTYNICYALSGGAHLIAPLHSVVENWVDSPVITLSFKEMEPIPTNKHFRVGVSGELRGAYLPAMIDLSGLPREQRKQRWYSEVRINREQVIKRLEMAVRNIIKDHLAGYHDDTLWMQGLFGLKPAIVAGLKERSHELGIAPDDLSVDIEIPAPVLKALLAGEAGKIEALTNTYEMTEFFKAGNVPLSPEAAFRFLMLNKSRGLRLRLTGGINSMVGSFEPLGSTGPLTLPATKTDTQITPVVSTALIVPAPRPPLYRLALHYVGKTLLLTGKAVLILITLPRSAYHWSAAPRAPLMTITKPEQPQLPGPTPTHGQLPEGAPKSRQQLPWGKKQLPPPDETYLIAPPEKPVGQPDFYGYLDNNDRSDDLS